MKIVKIIVAIFLFANINFVFADDVIIGLINPIIIKEPFLDIFQEFYKDISLVYLIKFNGSSNSDFEFIIEHFEKGKKIENYYIQKFHVDEKLKNINFIIYNNENPDDKKVTNWYIKLFNNTFKIERIVTLNNIFNLKNGVNVKKIEQIKEQQIKKSENTIIAVFYDFNDSWNEPNDLGNKSYFDKGNEQNFINKCNNLFLFKIRFN